MMGVEVVMVGVEAVMAVEVAMVEGEGEEDIEHCPVKTRRYSSN